MSERRVRKTEVARSFDRLPLNALRVFEAVAARLSFAAAADALHVTPAAVSMQIRTLEDYLRVPLFRRSGRTIALSAEGALLLPGVRCGLAELQQAMQQLRQGRSGGALNISTLASFLQKWLLPRLPQFHDRHPNIELSIHTSRTPVDFAQSDFHAALRMSSVPTPGLYNEKFLDEWFLPVCSRELLDRHGPLRTPADLKRYPLLRSSDESWSLWRCRSCSSCSNGCVRWLRPFRGPTALRSQLAKPQRPSQLQRAPPRRLSARPYRSVSPGRARLSGKAAAARPDPQRPSAIPQCQGESGSWGELSQRSPRAARPVGRGR